MRWQEYFGRAVLLLSIGVQSGFAMTWVDKEMPQHTWHPLITVTAGGDFIQTGESQVISSPPFATRYTGDSSWDATATGGVLLGVEKQLNPLWAYQLGAAAYLNSSAQVTGHIWQFTLPEFDNFVYHYHIQPVRVMAAGKLLGAYQRFHPYVSAEVGVAFNRASSYQETPLLIEEIPLPPFSAQRTTSFAWGVGAGVDIDVYAKTRLGIGYQFADLGKSALGANPERMTSESLALSHLYSNQIRLQLTYII